MAVLMKKELCRALFLLAAEYRYAAHSIACRVVGEEDEEIYRDLCSAKLACLESCIQQSQGKQQLETMLFTAQFLLQERIGLQRARQLLYDVSSKASTPEGMTCYGAISQRIMEEDSQILGSNLLEQLSACNNHRLHASEIKKVFISSTKSNSSEVDIIVWIEKIFKSLQNRRYDQARQILSKVHCALDFLDENMVSQYGVVHISSSCSLKGPSYSQITIFICLLSGIIFLPDTSTGKSKRFLDEGLRLVDNALSDRTLRMSLYEAKEWVSWLKDIQTWMVFYKTLNLIQFGHFKHASIFCNQLQNKNLQVLLDGILAQAQNNQKAWDLYELVQDPQFSSWIQTMRFFNSRENNLIKVSKPVEILDPLVDHLAGGFTSKDKLQTKHLQYAILNVNQHTDLHSCSITHSISTENSQPTFATKNPS